MIIYVYGGFHKLGVPQNRWFIMESPMKIDYLGVPLFQEIHVYIYIYMEKLNTWQPNQQADI